MTAIDALTRLCPPPTSAPQPIDWAAVETHLGMQLPTDYKELATAYGPGRFADYLQVYHPHGPTPYVDLTGPMPAIIRNQLQKDHNQGTHPVPYSPQRLFAMGSTDNGEYLFWITSPSNAPDRWRIAVNEARGPRWFTFDGTLTQFLVSVLNGTTSVPQFPVDLLQQEPAFSPSGPITPDTFVPPAPAATTNLDTIRDWARANGYDVPLRGRVPAEVREAFERAHRADAG